VRLTRTLLWISAVAFVALGLAFVIVPGVLLGVLAIPTSPTTEFLLRSEGLALAAAGLVLLLLPPARAWRTRFALLAVAAYLIVGAVVDLRAYLDTVVGVAILPIAALRIAIGALCVLAAIARTRLVAAPSAASPPATTAIDTEAAPADG
jgi:hypothetical protein